MKLINNTTNYFSSAGKRKGLEDKDSYPSSSSKTARCITSELPAEPAPVISRVSTTLLKKNLQTAEKIMNYVTTKIPYSVNKLDRPSTLKHIEQCRIQGIEPLSDEEIRERLSKIRELSEQKLSSIVLGSLSLEDYLKYSAEQAEIAGVGNCAEMSLVGYQFAHANDEFPEIFRIKKGDHAFLIIGRDRDSVPSDFKNWGDNAVICDSWSEKYYPASDIEKQFGLYTPTTESLQLFDSRHNSFELFLK